MIDSSDSTDVVKKGFFYKDRHGDTIVNWGKVIPTAVTIVIILIIVLVGWPMVIVGPTERGVMVTLGQVNTQIEPLQPGPHIKIPFIQNVKLYDLTPSKVTIHIPMGQKAALSSDKQSIGVEGEAIWKYNETMITSLATMYKDDGKFRNDVAGAIETAIRNTLGKHDITNIVMEQDAIMDEASDLSSDRFKEAGYPAVIVLLNLSNWDWSDQYDKMIEETQTMRQQAEKAKQELALVEQTSKKQVTEAEASARALEAQAEGRRKAAELDAQAAVAKASGLRDARIAEGEGERQYYASIQQTLTTAIRLREIDIEKIKWEKWNGKQVPDSLVWTPNGPVTIGK
jgi:regulator of protease activity HflC (stomatin/prohibitin superfamily)